MALAQPDLLESSWFLRLLKHELPDLFVPFVDDGRKDSLLARVVTENLKRNVAISTEDPFAVPLRSHAVGYSYWLDDSPPTDFAPADYEGALGRRVGAHAGMLRALWEIREGHWLKAARAGGVIDRFDEAAQEKLAQVPPGTRPLWNLLPPVTPSFIFADFSRDLLTRDLAFAAGLGAGAMPTQRDPVEVWLLHAWHLMKLEHPDGEKIAKQLGGDFSEVTKQALSR